MKITLVQFDIQWEDAPANLKKVDQLIRPLKDSDIIILPEMFSTGFSMNAESLAEPMGGPTVNEMKKWAGQLDALIMGSVIIMDKDAYYNRMIAAHPNGQINTYDKRHLFSYAGEEKYYSAGEDVEVFTYKDLRILPQICYDVRFPVFSRYSSKLDYDAIVYVANFPNKRQYAWEELLKARAIENEAYVFGVNRTGLDGLGNYYGGGSQIIDYSGKIIVYLSPGEWVRSVEIDIRGLKKFRQAFPFLKDRDTP
ncbi:MAG: amidohydrolase [Saprospiraceae bacterium]|nr:amidohydrolase [Saprospiraceae bacterium]